MAPEGTSASSTSSSDASPDEEPTDEEPTPELPTTTSGPPATTVAPTVESTADRTEDPPAEVIRVVKVSVTAPDADGAEQLVIDTEGGTPGYRVRYVEAVTIEGEPVLVDGTAFVELILQSADPQGEQGLAEEVAVDLVPDQPLVKQVQFAYYLGDELTYAIGLGERAPFTVTQTDTQIVITFS